MSLKNYDPARVFGKNLVENLMFPFENTEIGKRTIFIPEENLEGKKPDEIRALVGRSYDAFRRAEEWAQAQERSYTDEEALRLANVHYGAIHALLVANCCEVYFKRLEDGTEEARAEQEYLDRLNEKIAVNESLPEAVKKSAEWLCETWLKDSGPEHARRLVRVLDIHAEKQLAAAAILKADQEVPHGAPEEVWGEAFNRYLTKEIEDGTKYIYTAYIQYEAQDILENDLKPIEMPFEKLRLWAGVTWLEGNITKPNNSFSTSNGFQALTIGTAKIFAHQNTFLNRKTELPLRETLKTRKNNKSAEVLARSRLELPRGAERPSRAELLQKMTTTLAKHKANSASLVKTHLYNVGQAYKQGGSDPLFVLNMDHLLEAKGYQRRSDGSFHPDTYRKEWGRLITLSACWIELQPVSGKQSKKREGYIDAPYWQIEARYRLNDGESIGLQPFLLEDPEAPIIKQALIRPGLWWGLSDIGSKRFEIPSAVLALPTDGNGNETERYAVQLAATLAIWVRASQEQHAGKAWGYSVGKLLEASGLKTREEFEAMRTNQVGRLREYLAGELGDDNPRGAINILTSLRAFDIGIRDEDQFWASGRNWTDHFWEAKLDVQIPNLGIKKSGYKPSKGRRKT